MSVRDYIQQALYDAIDWQESLADAQRGDPAHFRECKAQARRYRAILDLIRPAFEAKEREIERLGHAIKVRAGESVRYLERCNLAQDRALSAEAKLAQAVEDEHNRCWVHVTSAMANETQAAQRRVLDAFRRSAAARGEKT